MNDTAAMDAICALFSEQEWSSDTANEVAEIVRATGRDIEDPDDGEFQ